MDRTIRQTGARPRTSTSRGRALLGGVTLTQVWALLVPAAFLVFLLGSQVGFIDLGYHLRAGEWMWTHGRWLDHDVFTFTVPGKDWLNQNWLAQVGLYWIARLGAAEWLVAVNALLFTSGFALLLRVSYTRSKEIRTAAFACVVAVLPSVYNTAVRPQSVSWLFMAFVLYVLETSHERPKRVLLIIPLTALWANIHGAFPVALMFLFIETGCALWDRSRGQSEERRFPYLALAATLSPLAALANPWGWRVYEYVAGIGNNPTIRNTIEEWQPSTVTTTAGALFFISVAVIVAAVALSKVRLSTRDLLRLALGAGLGLLAIRNGLWWTMAAAPPLASLLTPVAAKLKATAAGERPTRLNLAILATLGVVVVLTSPWLRAVSPLVPESRESLVRASTPVRAAGFLRSHDFEGNMFNSQSFGSYLELAAPQHPTFIDSRIELFTDELWSEYRDVLTAAPGWGDILSKRDIGYLVVTRHPKPVLVGALKESEDWKLAYSDRVALIYTRTRAADG
jgi:hypothetical protein